MLLFSGGHELLHEKLNAYFVRIIRIIGSQGGDIFKFAGDAMIVLWPKTTNSKLDEIVHVIILCIQSTIITRINNKITHHLHT